MVSSLKRVLLEALIRQHSPINQGASQAVHKKAFFIGYMTLGANSSHSLRILWLASWLC